MCRIGAERKRRRLVEAEVRESTEMVFEVYGEQLQEGEEEGIQQHIG